MLNKQNPKEKLSDLGEKEILNRLKKYMDPGQIDDDSALIKPSKKSLIVNTDLLVEDIHFTEKTIPAKNVGWKAVAINISDLAASGVEDILGITVGLIAPPSTAWNWIDNAYEGITNALNVFGGKLLGGDCSNGKQKSLSITAIGTQGPLNLHRSNAEPGDYLMSSGPHGLSRLGLGILLSDPLTKSVELPPSLQLKAINCHQQPMPPMEALRCLRESHPSNVPWRAAATDSSDGLLAAIQCLCSSSKCTAILEPNQLPTPEGWPLGKEWNNWCLEGGEDFELIVSLPPVWAEAWLENFPSSKKIGEIKAGKSKVIWPSGKIVQECHTNVFEHF